MFAEASTGTDLASTAAAICHETQNIVVKRRLLPELSAIQSTHHGGSPTQGCPVRASREFDHVPEFLGGAPGAGIGTAVINRDDLKPVVIEERKGFSPSISVLWALVPLLTLGWGTAVSFAYAALRLRDGVLGVWAWAYFVLGVTSFLLIASDNSGWRENAGAALALILIAVGSVHAFVVRQRLVEPRSPQRYLVGPVSPQVQALAEARTELQRRREARQILRTDPELGWQLRIGRPDLPRRYMDGGLVDANHASAAALAALPGISASLASEIVTNRDSVGGFHDLNDMSLTLGISPQTLDEAGAFLVFPRLSTPD